MDTSSQDTRGRGKNKRKWKYDEDAKLIEALLDMVNLGTYKAENGFKPGYLNYIEEKLQVSLPNSGFKAKPHIESRIKTLKKDFHIVYDMINGSNTSGFGMDLIKKCVTAEKSHPSHSTWQNKQFPFYDELLIIFGKDRATGNNAKGLGDMVEEIQRENTNIDSNNDVEGTMGNGVEDIDASFSFSPLHSPRNEGGHKKKKRKRSSSSDNLMISVMSDIKEAASVIGSEIVKASQVFSKAIGVDAEISEKR